jgi:uncharacterized membrane protein HdeD (DUF308 family)
MGNMKSANLIAMFLGLISIILGIYQVVNGNEFSVYFFSLFVGVTLAGVGFINYKNLDQ